MPEVLEVEVYLREPRDWTPWYSVFRRRAQAASLLQYCDPDTDNPTLVEPTCLTLDGKLGQLNDTATAEYERTIAVWEAADENTCGARPIWPDPITTLTDNQYKELSFRQKEYSTDL